MRKCAEPVTGYSNNDNANYILNISFCLFLDYSTIVRDCWLNISLKNNLNELDFLEKKFFCAR